MIEAVIFDVNGTLVDSVNLHAKAWQVAFEKFDKEVSFRRNSSADRQRRGSASARVFSADERAMLGGS